MNPSLEDAAATLGVSLPCPRQDARKAYLALLRQHRPERDPEGFRRIREAWETLARAGDPIGAASALSIVTTAEPPVTPEDDGPPPATTVPSSEEHPPEEASPGRWYRRRLDGAADDAEALAIVQAYLEAHPDAPDAYWLYIEEMEHRGDTSAIVKAAREALDRELEGFEAVLLVHAPDRLAHDELERLLADPQRVGDFHLARALAVRGRADEAASRVVHAMAHASRDYFSIHPPLTVVWALWERGAIQPATRAVDAIDEALTSLGLGTQIDRHSTFPAWTLTRELNGVAWKIDPVVVAPMAKYLSTHGSWAGQEAIYAAAVSFAADANAARRHLKFEARRLFVLVDHLLLGNPPGAVEAEAAVKAGRDRGFNPAWFAPFIVLMLIRAINSCGDHHSASEAAELIGRMHVQEQATAQIDPLASAFVPCPSRLLDAGMSEESDVDPIVLELCSRTGSIRPFDSPVVPGKGRPILVIRGERRGVLWTDAHD